MENNTRNIHILLDSSMSMKCLCGAVYLFIWKFLKTLENKHSKIKFTYQLTVFRGEHSSASDSIEHISMLSGNDYTEEATEIMSNIAKVTFKAMYKSSASNIKTAICEALSRNHGEDQNQILLVISDYYLKETLDFWSERAVSRVVMVIPENGKRIPRFRFVDRNGKVQINFPVLSWPIESLFEEDKNWTDHDWKILTNLLG